MTLPFLRNRRSLIRGLGRVNRTDDALKVFEGIRKKDTYAYNAALGLEIGQKEAVKLWRRMVGTYER